MTKHLVLVADGAHARLLEKSGLTLKQIGATLERSKILSALDKGSSKPGKIAKTAHVFAPRTDLEDVQDDQFARAVAQHLNKGFKDVETVILIAPPDTLGNLRKHLNSHILDKVDHEIAKDLTKLTEKEILPYVSKPYK